MSNSGIAQTVDPELYSVCFEELKRVFQEPSDDDPVFNMIKNKLEEEIKQANDSSRVFKQSKMIFHPAVYLQFPNSPTAQLYLKAFVHFTSAKYMLQDYKKNTVNKESDCEYLKPVFRNIVLGHISENLLFDTLGAAENLFSLVGRYLDMQPDDVFAEYVKVIILFRRQFCTSMNQTLSDYESAKLYIRTAEKLSAKLRIPENFSEIHREIHIDLLYYLGAKYVTTKQPERALNSFQKCYDLDNSNYKALYGVAYHNMESDPQRAILLFHKFINMAPCCDKQYPNAYYLLANIFLKQDDPGEAFSYCSLAEEAEKKRLPFLPPVDLPQKAIVQTFKSSMTTEQRKLHH